MNTTKKTAFGLTAATGAALLTVGFAAPAMADTQSSSTDSNDTTATSALNDANLLDSAAIHDIFGIGDLSNSSPLVLAPQIGDIASGSVGDIGSGNALASGNEVTAPVASGNETAVGSGNDTAISDNAVGNVTSDVSDVVDTTTDVTSGVSDVVDSTTGVTSDVSDIVTDVTNSVDVGGIVTDVTDAVDLDSILGR